MRQVPSWSRKTTSQRPLSSSYAVSRSVLHARTAPLAAMTSTWPRLLPMA
jgi:hypothetical protein